MTLTLQNIIRFVLLVLVQVLILNNIQFLGYINPYIYILFIFSLPYRTPQWLILSFAFILGLTIDIFSNTLGMHSFATVLMAFTRNGVIQLFISFEKEENPIPSFRTFGINAYLKFVIVMVLIHHTALFLLEAFSFSNFFFIFKKILLSSIMSIVLILGIQSFKKK